MSYFTERPRAAYWALLLILSAYEFFLRAEALTGVVGLFQRDLFLLYFPMVQSALRAMSEGALPLLDPSSAFGQPLLGNPSCEILYPPVVLHLLLPPHQAYAWFVSIHSVFGAMGVALLSRRFSGGSWLAALVGGMSWLVSGPLLSLATLWHHQAGAAWIPWVFLCVIRVAEGSQGRAAVVLGAAVGAQILAGSGDMCVMTMLLAPLFVTPRDYLRRWRAWLTGALTALALSAGVWLPAAELALNSARSGLSAIDRTYWSLHPLSVIEFFLPVPLSIFPFLSQWRVALFEGREALLGSMFLGTALLPLCLAALADAAVPRVFRFACFVGISGGFLIALGKHASAYAWAVTLIPPLGILRFPIKGAIPVAILACVLAGVGAAAIRRSSRSRGVALATAMILGAAALTLMGPLLGGFVNVFLDAREGAAMAQIWENLPLDLLFSIGLLGLFAGCVRWPSGRHGFVLACLLFAGHLRQSYYLHTGFNSTVPSALLGYKPDHLSLVRPQGDARLYVYDYNLFQGRAMRYLGKEKGATIVGLQALSPDSAVLVATRASLTPLVGAFWGVEYAWDADVRLLFDRRLAKLTVGIRLLEGTPGLAKLLQISGVSRVAALHEAGMIGLRLVARQKIFFSEPLNIFEVPDVLPRAFLTTGRRLGTGSDLRDLMDAGFDPKSTVLTDEGPVRAPVPDFVGRATILERRADRLMVETSTSHPAFLGVIEGAMPGWRVWVDGVSTTVERANAIFMGTEVPAGNHRVEFRFLPATAVIGVGVSAMTALFLLFAFTRIRPKIRKIDAAA